MVCYLNKLLVSALICILLSACSPPTLQQEHSWALKKHQYITDRDQYGIENKWVASLRGDCEDYALVMKNKVGGHLLYVRAYTGEAHIVLLVDGVFDKNNKPISGLVLDNMSRVVYPVGEMRHKYVYTIKESQIELWLAKAAEHDEAIENQMVYANP